MGAPEEGEGVPAATPDPVFALPPGSAPPILGDPTEARFQMLRGLARAAGQACDHCHEANCWPDEDSIACTCECLGCTTARALMAQAERDAALLAAGDVELLAALLECDTLRAAALLKEHGGIAKMAQLGVGALDARLVAAFELGRRASRQPRLGATLDSSRAVAAYMLPRFHPLVQEELWMLSLDTNARLRAERRVAVGGSATVSDVLRAALLDAAVVFVLVQYRPNGDPLPTSQDEHTTRAILAASRAIGVAMVDHIILTAAGEWRSLIGL